MQELVENTYKMKRNGGIYKNKNIEKLKIVNTNKKFHLKLFKKHTLSIYPKIQFFMCDQNLLDRGHVLMIRLPCYKRYRIHLKSKHFFKKLNEFLWP